MKQLFKKPLFVINIILSVFLGLLVLNANADRLHLPGPVREALAAVVNVVTDGGTAGKLTVFAAGTNNKIGDSIIQDNGINIGVGMGAPNRGDGFPGNPPGTASMDGTIFAAGHIAAVGSVNSDSTMLADDVWVENAAPTSKWVSALFSNRIAGSCEEYFPPTQTTSLQAVTFCWGAAWRVSDTTDPVCTVGTGQSIFNADDHVGAGETTPEGKNLSTVCDASGLCHISLYACIVR